MKSEETVFTLFILPVVAALVAIPLFLFLFLKLWARESWTVSLWLPGLVVGVAYFLFVYILRVPLHPGIIFG